jgi:predicted O-linked N-acetylglucosamine transferase (SPINDLY family)
MPLALPSPATPPQGAAAPLRAFRRWQAGQVHAQRDRWAEAAQDFEQAFATYADDAYGLHAAHALICAGRADLAVRRTRELRGRRPALALAYTLESHALLDRGCDDEAIACLASLPGDAPRDPEHFIALGVALQRRRRHDEAIGAFLQALAQQPNDPMTHYRLGMCFKDKAMKVEAAECVRTALLLGLGTSELAARAQLAFLEREACRWPQAEAALAELRAAVIAAPAGQALETGAFVHAVLVDDPLEQLKAARHYALHVAARVKPLPRRLAKAHDGPLRVAYLSADFHNHATSQLMVQMLECRDRERFEVTLVSAGPDDGSALRRRIAAACDRFEDVRGQSAPAVAQRIRALGIDILVDAKGATQGSLLPIVAHRAAPLQVGWLAFPGTSGAPFVDYLVGDPVVTPIADAAHFSERIAQMPHTYQPNDATRVRPAAPQRAAWGVPPDALLLCGFHQSYKISAAVFDSWCRLLHALPDARLWLLEWNASVRAALEAAARARGIDPARLLWAPLVAADAHLQRLACADVFLDTWPCNAHTTASEALWCGVPVVTLQGRVFAQRVAASLLRTVGLDETVCADVGAYEHTVVALAGDTARRAALRARLVAARDTSALYDAPRFARDFEALLLRMWQRAIAGLAPDHLPAEGADA